MNLDYKKLIKLLFPLSRDERSIEGLTPKVFIAGHAPVTSGKTTSLLSFADPSVRAAIHLAKFHNHKHAKQLLAFALSEYALKNLESYYICIPIPLSKKRKRERGYNQVEQILKATQEKTPTLIYNAYILTRNVHTKPQTDLAKEDRLLNLCEVFTVTTPEKVTGAHIVIIDDVTTTGATLKEAQKELRKYKPASITCIALAH